MTVHRPELLLSALFGGVLTGFANANWALEPNRFMRSPLLQVVVCLRTAFTARPQPPNDPPVGSCPRGLPRGLLFAASQCGVHTVAMGGLAGGGAP